MTQPYGEDPPENVAAAAQTRGFGYRLASRALANPLMTGGIALGLLVVCIALLVGVSAIGEHTTSILRSVLHVVATALCFGVVLMLIWTIQAFARGAQSFHVYQGGFVHRRNSKVTAYAWNEVAELKPNIGTRGDAKGKLLHYNLVTRAGKTVAVPLTLEDGRDPFMDQLMAMLDQNGIPVS